MAQEPAPQQQFNRRKFLGAAGVAAAFLTAYYFGIQRQAQGGYTLKNSRSMMGTIVNFTIIGPDKETFEHADMMASQRDDGGSLINDYEVRHRELYAAGDAGDCPEFGWMSCARRSAKGREPEQRPLRKDWQS